MAHYEKKRSRIIAAPAFVYQSANIAFIFSTLSSSMAFVACKYLLLVTSIVLWPSRL